MKIDGGCLCRHITYQAEVDPDKVAICHCTDCQTNSGTAFGVVVGMTTAIGTATILLIGVRHVQTGVLTLGDLLLIMSYVVQLYEPLRIIG